MNSQIISVPIKDKCFSHKPGNVNSDDISLIGRWERSRFDKDFVVLTHSNLHEVFSFFGSKKVYAWLIEPPEIETNSYDFVIKNHQYFEMIFTWESELLKISNKFHFVPFGGCWIEPKQRDIHEKTKNFSHILSGKKITQGHRLRHEIFSKFCGSVDFFGRSCNPIENKITALKDYRFQIVVENCKRNNWMTEKLIDCFQTGTIPIYWGAPNIDDFFDPGGIIQFENLEDLESILKSADEEFYCQKFSSIKENFDRSKKFIIPDDFIFSYFLGA